MLRIVLIIAGIAAMTTIFLVIRWFIIGISEQFGEGFVVGAIAMLLVLWGAQKADPANSVQRPKR